MKQRRRSHRLRASLGELTGWNPKPIKSKPRACPQPPDPRTRTILSALEAVPRLTADIGLATAARSDALVEVLPGSPTTVIFSAGGRLQGMLVVPTSENEARHLLGLEPTNRDIMAETLWEEQRRDDALHAVLR